MQFCWDVRLYFMFKILLLNRLVARKFQTILVGLCIGMLPMSLLAATTCPNPGMCFMTQKAKDEWALEHNCVFGTKSPSKDCSEKWRTDEDFLEDSEGELFEKGYVPTYSKDIKDKNGKVIHKNGEVIGSSGVTISTGIDLGQQSESGTKKIIDNYINEFGNAGKVDVDALLSKLNPYFGKQKQAALDALTASKDGLQISTQEASLLELAFGFDTQAKVAKQFDAKNALGMTFKKLPKEAQTAIVDFAYQYGISDNKGAIRQTFWNYVYAGQWQDLQNWLNSNPDLYKGRRQREGNLLQQGIAAGSVPSIGDPCAGVS